MNITRITLTGADERTDVDELVAIARMDPSIEIGLLYTATPEGRNRYPTRAWLADVLPKLGGQSALHVCGGGARRELLEGRLVDLTQHAPRVQVNGLLTVDEAEALASRVGTLITQHHAANASLLEVRASNHCILLDGSGGRGISPDTWASPETGKTVGRAGGLGPDNLLDELPRIAAVARPGAWVDMEGKLRVDDWFCTAHAHSCARVFLDWLRSHVAALDMAGGAPEANAARNAASAERTAKAFGRFRKG